jgi:hypothetical protein
VRRAAKLAILGLALISGPLWGQGPWATCTGGICYTGGNVGIGTALPTGKLEVSGAGIFDGTGLRPGSGATAKGVYIAGADYDTNHYSAGTTGYGMWFDGTNYKTATDGGSTGGSMIQAANGGDWLYFYTVPSSGTAQQTITPANLAANNLRMVIQSNGNVGIGTTNPQHLLHVAGTIGAEEVLVTSTGADYVFEPGYRLKPLSEVASYIQTNHHLPDIPSADEAKQKGMGVGEMEAKLLAKVEELTLHLIQQDKENRELQARVTQLEKQQGVAPSEPGPPTQGN